MADGSAEGSGITGVDLHIQLSAARVAAISVAAAGPGDGEEDTSRCRRTTAHIMRGPAHVPSSAPGYPGSRPPAAGGCH
jgi:hypothetical protein